MPLQALPNEVLYQIFRNIHSDTIFNQHVVITTFHPLLRFPAPRVPWLAVVEADKTLIALSKADGRFAVIAKEVLTDVFTATQMQGPSVSMATWADVSNLHWMQHLMCMDPPMDQWRMTYGALWVVPQ